ncbi:MAG TPA: 2-phospho-L-lactate guanylyltransferase [Ktedonobacteraceae bacterium]|nr:2-phospho-L-lactate guanylyltransferase [Ktedonobacteraceae bacterium]
MVYTALIPVKSLHEAKSRLATHLTQAQRAALMLDMLHHVLCILQASNALDRISVVSPDQRVLEQTQAWGAHARIEEVMGHNPALTAAATRELAEGATALLTISADLPLLQVSDIHGMIEQSKQYAVVLAPSQDHTGTNALLTRPPLVVPYTFGPESLQRYLSESRIRQLSSSLYTSMGLGLDIDTIDDLTTFRHYHCDDSPHLKAGASRSSAPEHTRGYRLA